jgi:hypothetical protein
MRQCANATRPEFHARERTADVAPVTTHLSEPEAEAVEVRHWTEQLGDVQLEAQVETRQHHRIVVWRGVRSSRAEPRAEPRTEPWPARPAGGVAFDGTERDQRGEHLARALAPHTGDSREAPYEWRHCRLVLRPAQAIVEREVHVHSAASLKRRHKVASHVPKGGLLGAKGRIALPHYPLRACTPCSKDEPAQDDRDVVRHLARELAPRHIEEVGAVVGVAL